LELKSEESANATNSGESALQQHAGHKITYGEIKLVRGGSEMAMMR